MMEGDDGQLGLHRRFCLAQRARCGDRAAFDALVAPIRGGLLGIAFVRTGDRTEAEDLTQEALARAWERIGDLHDAAAFGGWVRAILARLCASWHRARREPALPLDSPLVRDLRADCSLEPLAVLMLRQREERLRSALLDIPEMNRTALLMAAWGECSYQEIAEFAGVPVTTVEGRIHRAKSQLRRALRLHYSDLFEDAELNTKRINAKERSK